MFSVPMLLGRAAVTGGLALAGISADAAIPGRPDPGDVQTVDACLKDAADAKTDADACVGRLTDSCAEKATTTSMKEACSDRELLVWSFALNRDLAELTSLLPEEGLKQSLREVQRDVFLAKAKKCTFERIAHKDSPDSLLAAGRCDVRATARQDLWLREQIRSFGPH